MLGLVATVKWKLRYVPSLNKPVSAYYNITINTYMRPSCYLTFALRIKI